MNNVIDASNVFKLSADEIALRNGLLREESVSVASVEYHYAHLNAITRTSDGREVAKNVRLHLKHVFPKVKFSVKSDFNSINVEWTDGPTDKEVSAVVSLFKMPCKFGADDYYDYSLTEFNRVYGGVRYLFTKRIRSEALTTLAKKYISARYGLEIIDDVNQIIAGEYASVLIHRESLLISCKSGKWFYDNKPVN